MKKNKKILIGSLLVLTVCLLSGCKKEKVPERQTRLPKT